MAKKQRPGRTRKKKAAKRGAGSAAAQGTPTSTPSRKVARHQSRHESKEPLPVASCPNATCSTCAENGVRRSEELFRAAFEQTTHLIVLADAKTGQLLECNDPTCQAICHTDREFGELTFADLLGDGSSEQVTEHIEELLKQGSGVFETPYRSKGGEIRAVQASCRVLSVGGVDMISAVFSDITESKQAEEDLQTSRQELEAAVQQRTAVLIEINRQMKREIDRRTEADEQLHLLHAQLAHMGRVGTMGEMAAGLAHELNQPLCALATYAKACLRLVDSRADPVELREPLREVANEAMRAGEIIRRLRNFVRRAEPRRLPTDVNRLIPEVAQLLEHDAHRSEISMHFDLADGLPPVMIDAVQIQQVILNLIRNSIQVLAENDLQEREIKISTMATDDSAVLVTVQDTGPPVSTEIADRIFEPFFSTRSEGLGMGLPLSRSIVEDHGGYMWFAHCPERGSVFQFTLPVGEGDGGHDV
ncbi:MAG: PAS domain S-box protein [Planctomycetes bacterium]|nr:PAS domain S-box protein [Planctomycetota bacterium]